MYGGILGEGPKACTSPERMSCGVLPLRPEGTCSSPAWRTWDRHYGIGTHLRADGLLRPIKNMIALAFPGLLLTGETAPSGALRFHISGPMGHVTDASTESHRAVTIPPGPQTSCFI